MASMAFFTFFAPVLVEDPKLEWLTSAMTGFSLKKRTVGGKQKRFQKKTPLSYVLAPVADQQGNG